MLSAARQTASSGRSLHLITSQLRMKESLDCPNHIRRTKSSIKKRIIVRRSVRSMFGRTNIRPVKNGRVWGSAAPSVVGADDKAPVVAPD